VERRREQRPLADDHDLITERCRDGREDLGVVGHRLELGRRDDHGVHRPPWDAGDGEVRFAIERLDLVEGTYKLDVAIHKLDGYPYDYHRLLYTFRVKSRTKDVGIYRPPHAWSFSSSVQFTKTEED